MKLTIIESRYAGEVEENVRYARMCVADSLKRGESPVAFHLLHTMDGILNDDDPAQRKWGISAGLEWTRVADQVAVYTDRGISSGMKLGIQRAEELGIPIVYRTLENYAIEA